MTDLFVIFILYIINLKSVQNFYVNFIVNPNVFRYNWDIRESYICFQANVINEVVKWRRLRQNVK